MDQPATRSAEAVFAPAMTIALTIAPRTATLRALEDILFLRGVEPQTGRFVTQDEHAGTVVTAWGTRRGLGTKDLGRRTKDEGLREHAWDRHICALWTGTFAPAPNGTQQNQTHEGAQCKNATTAALPQEAPQTQRVRRDKPTANPSEVHSDLRDKLQKTQSERRDF